MNDKNFQDKINILMQNLSKGDFDQAEKDGLKLDVSLKNNHIVKGALGVIFLSKKKFDKADKYFKESIKFNPKFFEGYHNLGILNSLVGNENLDDAIQYFKKALELNPEYVPAYFNLGTILQKKKSFKESIGFFNKAIDLKSDFFQAMYNLGLSHQILGDFKTAEKYFLETIKVNPNYILAYNGLGILHHRTKDFEKSLMYFKKALELKPDHVETLINLGNICDEIKKYSESENYFKKAINLQPNNQKAYFNYGNLLSRQNKFNKAIFNFNEAIRINPNYFLAYNSKGIAHSKLGNADEAINCYRNALKINPLFFMAYSNLLLESCYIVKNNSKQIFEELKSFKKNVKKVTKEEILPYKYENNPQKLNVGFLSADFGEHPGGFFLFETIKNLKKKKLNLFAYSINDRQDKLAEEFKLIFNNWRSLEFKSDTQIINQVREDGIHILIDCMGHTGGNRLSVFAFKSAPIQLSYLGFCSTGLKEIDYFLSSNHLIPKEEKNLYFEKIWQLPEVLQCFSPPKYNLVTAQSPFKKNRYITFGSLNKLQKINNEVIKLWSQVLNSVSNSRIIIKCDEFANDEIKKNILGKFKKNGVSSDLISLLGKLEKREEAIKLYNSIDINLDTFPFQGNTTTCEAAWMGVPTLTLKGDRFLFHFGEAINANLGLKDWIAEDNKDFINIAIEKTANEKNLSSLRTALRDKLLKSPICDAPRLANHFDKMLWEMWKEN